MDITNFMTWFIDQVVSLFTSIFDLLASISFMGTNLLMVIVTITILVPLLNVVLTISKNNSVTSSRREKVKDSKERSDSEK